MQETETDVRCAASRPQRTRQTLGARVAAQAAAAAAACDGSDASATSLDVRMDLDRRHSVGEWDELMRKGGAGAVTR